MPYDEQATPAHLGLTEKKTICDLRRVCRSLALSNSPRQKRPEGPACTSPTTHPTHTHHRWYDEHWHGHLQAHQKPSSDCCGGRTPTAVRRCTVTPGNTACKGKRDGGVAEQQAATSAKG